MRLLRDHPDMAGALAARDISKSWALAIAEWTRKLPAELRAETIKHPGAGRPGGRLPR